LYRYSTLELGFRAFFETFLPFVYNVVVAFSGQFVIPTSSLTAASLCWICDSVILHPGTALRKTVLLLFSSHAVFLSPALDGQHNGGRPNGGYW
jgi:hypothetical protein